MRHIVAALFFVVLMAAGTAQAQRMPHGIQPFPHRDGPFSAMLMILDEKNYEELNKPGEGVRLGAMKEAKRGERIYIVIGFMGIGLNYDMTADVTFDFRLLDPSGKQVGDENKDIPALRTKIDNPAMVFHSQPQVSFAFDETDRPGSYTIEAVIRDNVNKTSVPLKETIALVE